MPGWVREGINPSPTLDFRKERERQIINILKGE
jgi:hypothetical protein